jgi:phage terminase large subunit
VREQLWREIAVAFHASGGFVAGELTDTRLELGRDWFALGLSTDTPERFAGLSRLARQPSHASSASSAG